MKFCSECGNRLQAQQRSHGTPTRHVCTVCRTVFYQDPRLSTGCIAERHGRILLCRRAVDPGEGLWELPSGFVAEGEAVQAAALREVLEEAGVAVQIDRPYALLHLPRVNQVRLVYLAKVLGDDFRAGAEVQEVGLFAEEDVPWNEIAFATSRSALRRYFEDRKAGRFGFFFAEIVPFEERATR